MATSYTWKSTGLSIIVLAIASYTAPVFAFVPPPSPKFAETVQLPPTLQMAQVDIGVDLSSRHRDRNRWWRDREDRFDRRWNCSRRDRYCRDDYRFYDDRQRWDRRSGITLRFNVPGLSRRHVDWCKDRYRSYNERTNQWLSYSGRYRQCVSPY